MATHHLDSVTRTHRILALLEAQKKGGLTGAEIAKRLGLKATVVHRSLSHMVKVGSVKPVGDKPPRVYVRGSR